MRSAKACTVVACLLFLPLVLSPFQLDLASQVCLACMGSLSLMVLTGFAGQISLGHAGLLAAGAFTVGIFDKELSAPFWIALPSAGAVGALLGLFFGFPSLRLRGLYLAVSTLALHFLVIYIGGEYENRGEYVSGILVRPPAILGYSVKGATEWYLILLVAAAATLLVSFNLLRSRTGRAWCAIQSNETVAQAIGIPVAKYKLVAFVISCSITAIAGGLFAYYRGFVSVEAFSIFLTIQYAAMIIVGGLGSLFGAVLGAAAITLFPYAIESIVFSLPNAGKYASSLYALNYAGFGLVMILFLLFEPGGLASLFGRFRIVKSSSSGKNC